MKFNFSRFLVLRTSIRSCNKKYCFIVNNKHYYNIIIVIQDRAYLLRYSVKAIPFSYNLWDCLIKSAFLVLYFVLKIPFHVLKISFISMFNTFNLMFVLFLLFTFFVIAKTQDKRTKERNNFIMLLIWLQHHVSWIEKKCFRRALRISSYRIINSLITT